jgi:hypothetical protein
MDSVSFTELKVKWAAVGAVLLSYFMLYNFGTSDWKVVTAAVISTILVVAVFVHWLVTWEVDDGSDGFDERWGS